jgi:tetratricopeptide (TPR) repeat protein
MLSGFMAVGLAFWVAALPPSYFQQGVEHVGRGEFHRAIAQFTESIRWQQHLASAHVNRCFAYIQVEQYNLAIVDCSISARLSPNQDAAYLNRGIAAYRLGQYHRAIQDFTQAIAIQPYNPEAWLNRGVTYADLGDLVRARRDLGLAADAYHRAGHWEELSSVHSMLHQLNGVSQLS